MTASTIQIPNDVLQPIINAHVAKAVSIALGDHSRLMEEAVSFALNVKVDSEGRPSQYNSATPFLQYIVNRAIREATTKAVHEAISADLDHIKAIVAKEIKNQRSPLVRQLIENIAKAAAEQTRLSVSVTVDGVKAY